MSYKPISNDQHPLDIVDDDGELDIVLKRQEKPRPSQKSFLIWIVIVTFLGAILIYIGQSNSTGTGQNKIGKNKIQNYTKVNKTIIPDHNDKIIESKEDQIQLEDNNLIDINMRNDSQKKSENINQTQNQTTKVEDKQENQEEENNIDFEELQKQTDQLNKEIKEYYKNKNETQNVDIVNEVQKDPRYGEILCESGYYMNKDEKKCKKCEDRCSECMHIIGTCYKCQNEYYLNNYGKCIQKCEGKHDSSNLLLSDDNKNQSIPICIGNNHTSSLFMSVQKSNNTHFVLPYLIIHPATTVSLMYHNNYPLVYYFNKDIFNFEDEMKLNDIITQAQEKQLIVIIIGSHTLYDFSLFNNFLFQEALQNIEHLVKAKSSTFRSFFGQDYNAYGVIREYQSQYKNNSVDLVISDDPIEIDHEYLESNLLVTHEQHYTDYNFESLQGAQSQKTTVILLFHTKNEQDQKDYCSRFLYVSFLQCAVREIQIDHIQRMRQGFELISQFVVQPDL
ncbi:unnamed protein product [Paramecium primaurelia]|uniref:Uncharacterized protein n=1 Tax=Paramecium primaurelia TaxID=5886 RepID=A0A8S1LW48_PARPR|nr:unnamed protein product [Paramecium primaurelia]